MSLSAVSAQLEQWAKVSAFKAARTNDPDSVDAMRKAQAQFLELQALVQASIVELDSYRRLAAQKPARARHRGGAARVNAPEFWRLHGLAVNEINARYGSNWRFKAPIGETLLVLLPPRYRSYKNERGVTIVWGEDYRIPAACFWPGACLPEGLVVTPDYRREDPEVANRARRGCHDVPVKPDASRLRERGYVWYEGAWRQEIEVRTSEIIAQQIVTDRERAWEQACQIPQPAQGEGLAEAAD